MADFTSWTAYLAALKNDLNNRGFLLKSYRSPDGTFAEYRSLAEIKEAIAYAESKADAESATTGVASRRSHAVARSDP